MKYAVYVEGRSELLLVADVLQKYSDYDPSLCGFRCYNLKADDLSKMNNPIQGDENSSVYYQIINVNNDNFVISKLNKDFPGEQLYEHQSGILKAHECDCRLHFAIMEYEAWMLALIENYVKNKGQNLLDLYTKFGINEDFDPEVDIYHPYPLVQKIFKACGSDYHKHDNDCLSFLSTLTKGDYENLRYSGRCASFRKFLDSLLGGECPIIP